MEAAIKMDILELHPFKIPKRSLSSYFMKVGKHVPTVLTPEEIKALAGAAQANAHNMAVFLFLLLSGMRKSELAGLKWDHVDMVGKRITFPSPKTDDYRTLPISETLVQLLTLMKTHWPEPLGQKAWIPRTAAQTTYVFCNKDGNPYRREIGGFLRHLAQKAGITKRVTPHVLRHSFAAYGRSRFTVFQLQKLLGHRNVTTTERYGILLDPGMQEGVNSLADSMGLNGMLCLPNHNMDDQSRPQVDEK
jgi:integrase/recombinase XerD